MDTKKTKSLKLPINEKITIMTSYATMVGAGITLSEATASLLEDAKGNQRKILLIINEDIAQGQRLNLSFAKFPDVFDKITVNLIKAAEESGTLDTTLKQIVGNIKKDMEFVDKIKSALFYPVFIIIVFFAMLLMILVVVVPKISGVFLNLRIPLPLPTKILILMSKLILTYTVPTVIALVALASTVVFLFKTKRRLLTQVFFSMPLISALVIKIDLTRFMRSLSSLLGSGILITNALELAEDIVINKEVRNAVIASRQMVLSGKNLSEGLKSSKKLVPSIVIRIIGAGEKSGSLEKSLQEVAEYLDYDVSQQLKTLTTLIEPIMLVFVGLLIGGIMVSIIAPIYGLIGQVGGAL